MRVVIDTCVWVAAVRSRRGAGFAILSDLPHGRFHFGISVALYLEYQASLLRCSVMPDVLLTAGQISAVLAALAYYGTEVPVFFALRPNLKDENDNMVFECAANFGADAIVTHNVKDFRNPELRGYGINILTPGEFLRKIRR